MFVPTLRLAFLSLLFAHTVPAVTAQSRPNAAEAVVTTADPQAVFDEVLRTAKGPRPQ